MDNSHTPVPLSLDLPVPPKPPGECVLFAGCKSQGYGQLVVKGRARFAHRLAWEAVHGPIPPGLVIDHLCRNRACINVNHMELVTNRVNTLRGLGQSAINARKTKCKMGHPLEGKNLLKRLGGDRKCRICHNEMRRAARALARKEAA